MTIAARRLGRALLVLWGVSILSFVLFELAPGDFASEIRINPQIPAETVHQLREQYGLDKPFVARYASWLQSVLRGDFGISFAYNLPVSQLLPRRLVNTLILVLLAMALTWFAAVPLGAYAAARPHGSIARATKTLVAIQLSLPDLLVGLACLYLAVRTGWFRPHGSLALCVLALALVTFPAVFRHVERSVSGTLAAPFARHLEACGVSPSRILIGHALPAALNPLITLLGLAPAALFSEALVLEVILGWPGLGPLLLEAILSRDVMVVLATVMVSTVLLVAGNGAADLLLSAADPRIRRERA